MSIQAPYILVLVHGTWAKNARWTADDAPLAATLCRLLGPGVLIQRFQWSGSNSYKARRTAGIRLAELLEKLITIHPSAKLFIIAHSHGGNVARYALERGELAARVNGLVTIATPFLEASARKFELLVALACHGIFFLLAIHLLVHYATPQVIRGIDFAHSLGGWKEIAVWLGSVYLGYFLGNVIWGFYRGGLESLTEAIVDPLGNMQDKLMSSLSTEKSRQTPMFVTWFGGDEAGLWLKALHWLTEPFSQIMKTVGAALLLASVAIYLVIAADILLKFAAVLDWTDPGGLGLAGAAGVPSWWNRVWNAYKIVLPVYLLSVMLVLLIPKLIRGHFGGFGSEQLSTAFLTKIPARRLPRDSDNVFSIRYDFWAAIKNMWQTRGSALFKPSLIHSALYTYPDALKDIGSWIERTGDIVESE